MATRATPSEYWRAKMQTQVSAPVTEPLPVQNITTAPSLVIPELNSSAIFVLGLVAAVGLIGLFALLGTANKCRC